METIRTRTCCRMQSNQLRLLFGCYHCRSQRCHRCRSRRREENSAPLVRRHMGGGATRVCGACERTRWRAWGRRRVDFFSRIRSRLCHERRGLYNKAGSVHNMTYYRLGQPNAKQHHLLTLWIVPGLETPNQTSS